MKVETPAQGRGGNTSNSTDPSILEASPANSQHTNTDSRSGMQFKCHVRQNEWMGATVHLSFANQRHLLWLAFAEVNAKGPIPDSPKVCCRILGLDRSRQWKRIRRELLEARVITILDGYIHIPQAQEWRDIFNRASQRNRRNIRGRYNGIQGADE